MSQASLFTCTQPVSAYIVNLDATHIVEVRKQGEELGIYKVTISGKKRGVLLPIAIWHTLVKFRHLINVAVDLSVGTLTTEKVAETVNQHIHSCHQQVQPVNNPSQSIKYIYTNNVSARNSYQHPCNRTPHQGYISKSSANCSTITPTTTAQSTTPEGANRQHVLYKHETFGGETVPLMDYFEVQGGNATGPGESTSQEEATGDADTYCAAYVC